MIKEQCIWFDVLIFRARKTKMKTRKTKKIQGKHVFQESHYFHSFLDRFRKNLG